MLQEQIDIKKWREDNKQALEDSRQAYIELLLADQIQELHARVAARTKARIKYDKAMLWHDKLRAQWGQCWRDQNGKIVK